MNSLLKNNKKDRKELNNSELEEFKKELNSISSRLKKYEQQFNMTENDDLLEALIYEHKALESRYAYLVKKARDLDIVINFYERI